MDRRIQALIDALDEAYDRQSWHGTNLRGSLRRVSGEALVWRPATGRHNIWELAVHAAYWKYAVRRRLTGEKRGSFALAGSDWFERPARDRASVSLAAAWQEDLALLGREHRLLRAAVAGLPAARLDRPAGGGRTAAFLVRGVTAHDLYHAGQIQLIKRLRSRDP